MPRRAGILLALVCAAALPAAVRSAPSIDPALVELAKAPHPGAEPGLRSAALSQAAAIVDEDGQVDVWLVGSIDPTEVARRGGTVRTVAGQVMTTRVPLEALGRVLSVPGLQQAQIAQAIALQSDVSVPETGAPELWGASPPAFPPTGDTGKNVVVGILDTGIDPTHSDFRFLGSTRVLSLWDQNFGQSAPPPAGFNYGSEYSSAAIDAGQYTLGDADGHGSLVAGIAAGNGSATGNGQPPYHYVGVAPEANLVVVRLKPNLDGNIGDDKILDGTSYVFQRATQLGRPAVVLVAASKPSGPHDGSDPLDLGLTALSGPGKVVVAAAGNYGATGRHAEWTSAGPGSSGDVALSVTSYTPSPSAADNFRIEGWYDSDVSGAVSVVTPGGAVIGPVALGATANQQTSSGIVDVKNGVYRSGNGAYRVEVYVYRGAMSYPVVATGTWTVRFDSQSAAGRRFDCWITSYMLGSTQPRFVTGMTDARLVASPASADSVVAVAAYSTKRSWIGLDGRSYFYSDAAIGDRAPFSSPGPRRDGMPYPHIAAPGFGVAGSRSAQSFPSSQWIMPDGVHRISYGTSLAAAHVAGAVALLLQNDPTLGASGARSIFETAAAFDQFTGPVPNSSWGAGKLRLSQPQSVGVGDSPVARFATPAVRPNPTRGPASFEFSLSGAEALSAKEVRLRILDVRGHEISAVQATPAAGYQRLFWNGRTAGGAQAPAGIYFYRLELGKLATSGKLIRIQ